MAVNSNNIEQLASPAVVNDNSLSGILGDLVRLGGQAYVNKKIAERTPPAPTTLNNTDTAKGELAANANMSSMINTKTLLIGAFGLIVVGALIFAVRGR